MRLQKTWAASRKTKAETGFRSGLEETTATSLDKNSVPYMYEGVRIPYTTTIHYLADFILTEQAIVIEDKGAFLPTDRAKMLKVKQQHPDLDIRFLFSNPHTRLGKQSKTTYAMWCDKHGFPYAKGGDVPQEWIEHIPTNTQKEALYKVLYGTHNN